MVPCNIIMPPASSKASHSSAKSRLLRLARSAHAYTTNLTRFPAGCDVRALGGLGVHGARCQSRSPRGTRLAGVHAERDEESDLITLQWRSRCSSRVRLRGLADDADDAPGDARVDPLHEWVEQGNRSVTGGCAGRRGRRSPARPGGPLRPRQRRDQNRRSRDVGRVTHGRVVRGHGLWPPCGGLPSGGCAGWLRVLTARWRVPVHPVGREVGESRGR
jgi:hypothetical protein